MATSPRPNDRQAKIQAAAKQSSSGPNKIIIGTVVAVLAIVAIVGGVIWKDLSNRNAISGGGTATPAGTSMGEGYRVYPDVQLVAGAPKLDVYEDFQCPACANFEAQLGDPIMTLAKEGKAEVRFHVKNFLDANLRNDSSTRAGIAAFCAADAGKFVEYHKAVFAGQPANEGDGYTNDQLAAFAQASGITGGDLTTFKDCLKAEKYKAYVNSVEEASAKDKVTGTPTLRLNGADMDRTKITSVEAFVQMVTDATKK